MKTVCEPNKCNGCMACRSVCPKQCILVQDDIVAFNAIIDESSCVECDRCKKVCPNTTVVEKRMPVEWKQGWADRKIRSQSSSGGAASALMRSFIAKGGFVASCLFKEGKFVFEITKDMNVVKRFAGSKYVKSDCCGIYEKVAARLKTHKVLFIGLPCQVAALQNYVQNKDDLYTVDLICHGTPSYKLLDKFLREHGIEPRECSDIHFRSNTSMGMSVDGITLNPEGMDDYLRVFLDSLDYTENCYTCQFARLDRVGDITLGDSWGSEYKDELKKGVSLLLIQSERGKELVYEAEMELKDVDISIATRENQQLMYPCPLKPERDKFLDMIKRGKSFSSATFAVRKKFVIKRAMKKAIAWIGTRKRSAYNITVI